jgi:hypothetical protein
MAVPCSALMHAPTMFTALARELPIAGAMPWPPRAEPVMRLQSGIKISVRPGTETMRLNF